jgi:hypothetical protein
MCSLAHTWGQKLIQFPKCCVYSYLEFWMMDKVQKSSDTESNTNQITFVQTGWSSLLFEEPGFVYKFKTKPLKLYIISYTKLDECCLIPTVPHQSPFSASYLTLCLFIRVIWLISRIFSESNSHLASQEIFHGIWTFTNEPTNNFHNPTSSRVNVTSILTSQLQKTIF